MMYYCMVEQIDLVFAVLYDNTPCKNYAFLIH